MSKQVEFKETGIYKRGQSFAKLGKLLMNKNTTIMDISKASLDCGLHLKFCLEPEEEDPTT